MVRGRRVVGVLATVLAIGVGGAAVPALAGGSGSEPASPAGQRLRVLYTSPVLVRTGERVLVPVDATCATAAGRTCAATVTMAVRSGEAPWRSATASARPDLRFDLSAPAARAAGPSAGGAVDFTIRATSGSTAAALPGAGHASPLRFYVTGSMPTLAIPAAAFGALRPGTTALFLPWGSGPTKAGLVPGNESLATGPSAFDVDAQGRIHLMDGLQDRLAVFDHGRLVRQTPVEVGARPDVAVADDGTAYVLASTGGLDGTATIQRIGPDGRRLGEGFPAGQGMAAEVRMAGDRPFVHQLPADAWTSPGGGAAPALSVGRPLAGGGQLLTVVRGNAVRLGLVDAAGRVGGAVELTSSAALGELALGEPDGRGGYVVVVHVWRDGPAAADRYQVIHVSADRSISTFTVPNEEFAETAPLSKFRLGPDGALYQLTSSPDGMRIVRYQIGGEA